MQKLSSFRVVGTVLITSLAALVGTAAASDVASVARGNNAFAIDLYRELNSGDGNLCFSPYSISLAFGMAGSGAGGRTADQIGAALHLGGPPVQSAIPQGELLAQLNAVQSAGDVELAIANSIWPERTYPFRADYLRLLDKHFKVGIVACDFVSAAEQERLRINQWAEQATHDRIKDLLPAGSVNAATRLVLANAVYFKGNWKQPFVTEQTQDRPFYTAGGEERYVPMMRQEAAFRFGQFPGLRVLSMPYGGDELSMVILLPEESDGLATLEASLSTEKLGDWIGALRTREVTVQFPRFTAESSFNLNEAMQALGMTDAYSANRADFSGMTERNDLCISDAFHKAFVEVTEEGTEAAAATAITIRVTSMQPKKARFVADRPFLYLIRHHETGTILFMGRLMNPGK